MENIQNVEQVTEVQTETVTEVQDVTVFPTDEMLETMGMTREEFEQKVEENKQLTHEQQMEKLDSMEEENKKLQEELEQLNKQMQHNSLISSLNAEGLSEFVGLFDLTTNVEKVAFLKEVKNQILVANSYIPKDVAKQDEYTQAIQNKDVKKSLELKFSKLFGGK